MIYRPSLNSHLCQVERRVATVDDEGTPSQALVSAGSFLGGFGAVSTAREQVTGQDGQRVDAAVSALGTPDVKVGDRLIVAGRQWAVVGIRATGIGTRVLLAAWGSQ